MNDQSVKFDYMYSNTTPFYGEFEFKNLFDEEKIKEKYPNADTSKFIQRLNKFDQILVGEYKSNSICKFHILHNKNGELNSYIPLSIQTALGLKKKKKKKKDEEKRIENIRIDYKNKTDFFYNEDFRKENINIINKMSYLGPLNIYYNQFSNIEPLGSSSTPLLFSSILKKDSGYINFHYYPMTRLKEQKYTKPEPRIFRSYKDYR